MPWGLVKSPLAVRPRNQQQSRARALVSHDDHPILSLVGFRRLSNGPAPRKPTRVQPRAHADAGRRWTNPDDQAHNCINVT